MRSDSAGTLQGVSKSRAAQPPPTADPKKVSPEGAMILRARRAMQLTQKALAKRSKVSRPTIARIETGESEFLTPRTLEKLAGALGLTVADIKNGAVHFADPIAAVDAYLKSPYAQIDAPEDAEIEWMRALPPLVWAGQAQPDPRSISKLLEFHRIGKPRKDS